MRAFRPGRFSVAEEDEDVQRIKQVKMLLYAARAKARLPLFEDALAADEPGAQRSIDGRDQLSA